MADANEEPRAPSPAAPTPEADACPTPAPLPPLSPAFLWHKLVESWKRNPWPTIATLITIAGAILWVVARLGPWLLPALGGVALAVIVGGLGYFTWDAVRFSRLKRLATTAPSDTWAEVLLRKEMYAAGCLIIAILVTMPSGWNSPKLHVAEAHMAEYRRELDEYLDRDEPDERTNEQKLADSMETLARNEELIALARGVGTGQYVVRYGLAVWALLLALFQHGVVMVFVLLTVVRLAEARRGGLGGHPSPPDEG